MPAAGIRENMRTLIVTIIVFCTLVEHYNQDEVKSKEKKKSTWDTILVPVLNLNDVR